MCGIAGFIDLGISKGNAEGVIMNMLMSIKHRGPDHTGFQIYEDGVVLGHNRLSIIDLSEIGNQPFEYKHLSITYNGEIYNYKEIRKELLELGHRFRSETDTEVILAAYDQWGGKCVERFLGMWAFTIWDKEKRELFCSRDRFGIKPFFYSQIGDGFYFASEIKALKKVKGFNYDLNEKMNDVFIGLGWNVFGEETCFKAVKILEPGYNMVLKNSKIIKKNKYWDLNPYKKHVGISEEDAIAGFLSLFEDSMRLHMRSDVPVGAMLSGGIDSSAIVSLMSNQFKETNTETFSIYYTSVPDMDERPYIHSVLKKYLNLKSHLKEPGEQEIFSKMDYFINNQDLPLPGSSYVSSYMVYEMAKEAGIKVIMSGQGADEYLVGYLRSFYRIVSANIISIKNWKIFKTHIERENFSLKEIIKRLILTMACSILSDQKMHQLEFLIRTKKIRYLFKSPFKLKRFKGEKLNEFLYNLLFYTEMPTNLYYADLYSMQFSIECRVPFLDHRLVEYVFALPDELKIKNGITKFILRESCKDYLPVEVYERKDKKGFVSPGEKVWLKNMFDGRNNSKNWRYSFFNSFKNSIKKELNAID
jgi:asparagine synthase (glutamine-hydrolysing)